MDCPKQDDNLTSAKVFGIYLWLFLDLAVSFLVYVPLALVSQGYILAGGENRTSGEEARRGRHLLYVMIG
jgi:hypothetical protein